MLAGRQSGRSGHVRGAACQFSTCCRDGAADTGARPGLPAVHSGRTSTLLVASRQTAESKSVNHQVSTIDTVASWISLSIATVPGRCFTDAAGGRKRSFNRMPKRYERGSNCCAASETDCSEAHSPGAAADLLFAKNTSNRRPIPRFGFVFFFSGSILSSTGNRSELRGQSLGDPASASQARGSRLNGRGRKGPRQARRSCL